MPLNIVGPINIISSDSSQTKPVQTDFEQSLL